MRICRLAVVLAVLLTVPNATRADDPGSGSLSILNGSSVVPALNYVGWDLRPDFSIMDAPTVEGHVTASGGSGNDIQVLVFTDTQFLNWKNNHTVTPLYNSGQVTAADVHVALPEPGTYHVILSNMFSPVTPKTVEGTLRMTWQPSAAVLAQQQAELDAAMAAVAAQQKAALRNIVLTVVASAFVGGAIAVLIVQARKKKVEPEKVKTAA